MILKALGMIMIIGGSGLWGLSGAKRLEKRLEQLADLKIAIAFLEKEISYMHTNLSQALQKTAAFSRWPVNTLFAGAAAELSLKRGITAQEAWLRGLSELYDAAQLQPADFELLAAMAPQLGISNDREQQKALAVLGEELGLQQQKASGEKDANQKLWSYGGFILGTAIVLLMV